MKTNYNPTSRITTFQKVGFLALVLTALGSSISARGATVNWIAASADVYTNTVDWSTGNLPAAADTAVIGNTTISNGSILYTNNPGDPPPTNIVSALQLGGGTNSSGTFTMGSGSLTISNAGANALVPGNGTNAVGTFIMNGGNLTCLRNASTFFQDFLVVGNGSNTVGTFTLNGGTANFRCGIEIGTVGVGTINVNGGTFIDNGWFGVGRGNSVTSVGQGFFNLTGGTVYLLRNPGTEGQATGIAFTQNGTNGVVNISGGSLYAQCIRFAVGPGGTSRNDYETLNVSGGDIYLGSLGVFSANGTGGTHNISVTLSGGTFHTVDLAPNTGGTNGLASVLTDGANWTWSNSASISPNFATSPGSGTVTFAPDTNRTITLAANFGGTGNLAMPGPGTLVISGNNSYAGNTTITGGTVMGGGLIVGGPASASSAVTIEPGTALVPNTLTLGLGLTLNGNTNIIKLSGNAAAVGGGINDLLVTAGNLSLQGVCTVQIVPLGPLASGTPYTIMQYSGTPLTSGDAAHLHVVSSSPRYNFSVVDPSTTPGSIQILVTGNAANLRWNGGVAGNTTNWDNTTTNWFNTGTSALDSFFNGDVVTFSDSAATNLVNVVGTQQPIGIEFNNNSLPYTITGGTLTGTAQMDGSSSVTFQSTNAPLFTSITNNTETMVLNLQNTASYTFPAAISDDTLGRGTIIKANTNTAVLTADNSAYYGAIIVSNGTLQYTSVNGLGHFSSQLYMTNVGTLDLNGVSPGLKAMIVSGSGYNGQGAIVNSVGSVQGAGGVANLTLVGDTTLAASNRWDPDGNGNPGFNGNGFNITFIGPGSMIITDEGETSIGNIHVTAGRVGFQGIVTMGDPTKTATLEAGTTLTFFSVNNSANPGATKNVVLNSATFDSAGASNNFNGPISVTGTSFFGTRSTLHVWGPISGPGGIVLGNDVISPSAGDLYLDGTNTYGGNTTISNRTLFVGANSSLGSSPLTVVLSGGKLDVTSQPTYTFISGQILAGNGAVGGNSVVFASGAVLAPGTGGTNASSLTNSGSLTLQSGSTNVVVVDKTATVTNSAVVGLTSVSIGGTLVVSNYGNALAGGDAIPIFSSAAYSGGYSQIIPATPGPGMTWNTSTLTTDGTLRITSSGPPNTPTNIVFAHSPGQLTLSWPSNYTGWVLQGKTNNPGVGIQSGTWSDIPGSSNTNNVVITLVPTNGPTFYRMILRQ